MDSLRGLFADESLDRDHSDDHAENDLPPATIGTDERRMQVRAYNFWASLLDNRNLPDIAHLKPETLADFGPYSVLLDFTDGIDDPVIRHLGDKIAEECGTDGQIQRISDIPSRSLLSRITDHYMQILANQAPIGFEAEFINNRGITILYRGILLPFSSDGSTIDYIYGVINWKELADQRTADELLLEINQALEGRSEPVRHQSPLTSWADGPVDDDGVLDLVSPLDPEVEDEQQPTPSFASSAEDVDFADDEELEEAEADLSDADMGLADWLASARELAHAAHGSEDRSRQALYLAIGRAYDFSLAAAEATDEFREIVADAGLTMQERAPMTPVVKLVFGADYDKTRLTEYAAALNHAHRLKLERGTVADFLSHAHGGLKGVVNAERKLKREESGKSAASREAPRDAVIRKLRNIAPVALDAMPMDGAEFTVLVARRMESGEMVVLGEVADDAPLLERAARHLIT